MFKRKSKRKYSTNKKESNSLFEGRHFVKSSCDFTSTLKCNKISQISDKILSIPIRVASYNVLAQYQLMNNRHLYNHCQPQMLDWEYRRTNILKEITKIDADILCMQEVEDEHYVDFFEPNLSSMGYSSFYNKKSRNKKDGVSISFKKEKFTLTSQVPVNYFRSVKHPLLNSDNVGYVLLLEVNKSNSQSQTTTTSPPPRICIANTHLFFNPNRGDIKLAQLCLLLQELDQLTKVNDNKNEMPSSTTSSSTSSTASSPSSSTAAAADRRYPIIICGDFNAEPNSILLKFLHQGKLLMDKTTKVCQISAQNESSFPAKQSRLETTLADIEFPSPLNEMIGANDCDYDGDGDCGGAGAGDSYQVSCKKSKKCCKSKNVPVKVNDNDGDNDNCVSSVLRHNLPKFIDSHSQLKQIEKLATSFTCKGICSVDYILFTHSCNENVTQNKDVEGILTENSPFCLCLESHLSLLSPGQLHQRHGLPNWSDSSDHIPLVSNFILHTLKSP